MPRPVEELPNLGPVMARRLREIGIVTDDDLRCSGALRAFAALRSKSRRGLSLNALYAMEAALPGLHWRDLPPERRRNSGLPLHWKIPSVTGICHAPAGLAL